MDTTARSRWSLRLANKKELKMEDAPIETVEDETEDYPTVEEMEEEEEEEEEETTPLVITPAAKKRGRPSGSKKRPLTFMQPSSSV